MNGRPRAPSLIYDQTFLFWTKMKMGFPGPVLCFVNCLSCADCHPNSLTPPDFFLLIFRNIFAIVSFPCACACTAKSDPPVRRLFRFTWARDNSASEVSPYHLQRRRHTHDSSRRAAPRHLTSTPRTALIAFTDNDLWGERNVHVLLNGPRRPLINEVSFLSAIINSLCARARPARRQGGNALIVACFAVRRPPAQLAGKHTVHTPSCRLLDQCIAGNIRRVQEVSPDERCREMWFRHPHNRINDPYTLTHIPNSSFIPTIR